MKMAIATPAIVKAKVMQAIQPKGKVVAMDTSIIQ